MNTVIIGIGLPAAGKTRALSRLNGDLTLYIEIDAMIKKHQPSEPNDIWPLVFQVIAQALESGQNVVLDSTNTTVSDRVDTITVCKDFDCRIVGVWFNTPFDVCVSRNQSRVDAKVSQESLSRMADNLKKNPPSLSEGFDILLEANRDSLAMLANLVIQD